MSGLWGDKLNEQARNRKRADRSRKQRRRRQRVQNVRHPVNATLRHWGFR